MDNQINEQQSARQELANVSTQESKKNEQPPSNRVVEWVRAGIAKITDRKGRGALEVFKNGPASQAQEQPTQPVEIKPPIEQPPGPPEQPEVPAPFDSYREIIGMPPEKSFGKKAAEGTIARQQAIDTFLENERKDSPLKIVERELLEVRLTQSQERYTALLDTLSFGEKTKLSIERALAAKKMRSKGVQNADKIIDLLIYDSMEELRLKWLEDRVKAGNAGDINKELISIVKDDILKDAADDTFIQNCLQIGDVVKAHRRLDQLAAPFEVVSLRRENYSEQIPIIKEVTLIPDSQYTTISNDLAPYLTEYGIFSGQNNLRGELFGYKPLIDFIATHPPLTEEEKKVFDYAHRVNEIYQVTNTVYEPTRSGNPTEILQHGGRYEDEHVVLGQLLAEKVVHRYGARSLIQGFRFRADDLSKNSSLNEVAELIRSGVDLGPDNVRELGGEYRYDKGSTEEDSNILTKVSKEINEEQSDMLRFLVRLTNKEDSELFPLQDAVFMKNVVENYDEVKANVDTVMKLVEQLSDDPKKRRELSSRFLVRDDHHGIRLAADYVFRDVSKHGLENFSDEEKKAWARMLKWNFTHGPESFVIGHDALISELLIQERQRFSELVDDEGRLTDTFIEEISQRIKNNPDYHNNQSNKDDLARHYSPFILDPERVPPSLKPLADLKATMEPYTFNDFDAAIGNEIDKWPDFITDGKVNISFVEHVLSTSVSSTLIKESLKPEMIENLPAEEQEFWKLFMEIQSGSPSGARFLWEHKSRLNEYYTNGSFNGKFLGEYATYINQKGYTLNSDAFEELQKKGKFLSLNPQEHAIWGTVFSTENRDTVTFTIQNYDTIQSFFEDDNKVKPELFIFLATNNMAYLQNAIISELDIQGNPTEKEFYTKWRGLPEKGQQLFNKRIADTGSITEKEMNDIRLFQTLFEEIRTTHSQELAKIQTELIDLLLESSNPLKDYQEIKSLFERNNLPDIGKRFRIFEILYSTPGADGRTRMDKEIELKKDNISPTLTQSSDLRRIDTIYRDLLRVSVDSADQSLYIYLNSLNDGQGVLSKMESNGYSSLAQAEQRQLARFLQRAGVLYDNSLLGRTTPQGESLPATTIEERVSRLKDDLKVRPNQPIVARLAEMFAEPIGYSSIEEVLEKMNRVKQEAHARNSEGPRIKDDVVEVHVGDLLKGVGTDAFDYIIRTGTVAREYIGIAAESDSTPFDTDTGMVFEEDIDDGLAHALSVSPSNGYGEMTIVIHDRGQFVKTDQKQVITDKRYNSAAYEIFPSYVHGERHYGVRTGLPSTEIDAVILRLTLLDDDESTELRRKEIYFNIANNGFYIPVANPIGELLFTENDYYNYRLDAQNIRSIVESEDYTPTMLIEALKSSPYIKTLYEMSAGVQEGYSTEEHTDMVMNQFEKYFSNAFESSVISREELRLLLALHDIGKPMAVRVTGSTEAQHEYTKKVMNYALQSLELSPTKVDTLISLVDQDIIGEYFKGSISAGDATTQITELSSTIGVTSSDLLATLRMFYISDASAYTTDAGAPGGLDNVFSFQQDGNGNHVSFSQKNEALYNTLTE
ncbi:MAG: hypothetical protein ABIO02_01715, partial [Patescibacteria group bacterium]